MPRAASSRYESGNRSCRRSNVPSRKTGNNFEVGAISTYDYLLGAKQPGPRPVQRPLQNKYDFLFRLKVLDFYQGKPLSF